jgi:hypothetical protein
VDDILGVVDTEEAKLIETTLKRRFGDIQFETGDNLSYLGMQVSIGNEGTTVDKSYYVTELLKDEVVEVVGLPTMKDTYKVDERSVKLSEVERKWYHSKTAKLPEGYGGQETVFTCTKKKESSSVRGCCVRGA